MHEEMNSISNMLSFRSSTNFVCTCFAGEICMNKILFKPTLFRTPVSAFLVFVPKYENTAIVMLHGNLG